MTDTNADTPVQNQTTKIVVSGMTCGHCVSSVQEEIGELEGVTAVDVDLISSDAMMPEMGGLELLAALRATA